MISGDTHASEAVVNACHGCDVLVHEVYSDAGFRTLTPEWKRYHSNFHTSANDLAALATRAPRPAGAVSHADVGGVPRDTLVAEVKRGFADGSCWHRISMSTDRVSRIVSATALAFLLAATSAHGQAPAARGCTSPRPEWIFCDDFETNRLGSYFESTAPAAGSPAAPGWGVTVHTACGYSTAPA